MRESVQESQRMQNFPSQLVSMNQLYHSLNSFLSNETGFYVIKKMFRMQCLLRNILTWNFKNLVEGLWTKLFLQFLLSFLVSRYSIFCIVEMCHKLLVSCSFCFMDVWKCILKTNSCSATKGASGRMGISWFGTVL